MSLYPTYLKIVTALRKLEIKLHLTHPPHLADREGNPLKGINARYHGDDDSSPTNLLVRTGVKSGDQLKAVLASGAQVIALVEEPDINLVYELGYAIAATQPTNLVAIELGNEVDLTGLSARDYSYFLESGFTFLRHEANYKGNLITGGISRVRPDTLAWLGSALRGVLPNCWVGIHRYSVDNDATAPQDGYVNREEECNAILDVAAGRAIAITEFGYPILDGAGPDAVATAVQNVKVDLDYFSRLGAKYAIYYQWLNGPTNTAIDRFGLKDRPEILALLNP